jgi:hypothetical protein
MRGGGRWGGVGYHMFLRCVYYKGPSEGLDRMDVHRLCSPASRLYRYRFEHSQKRVGLPQ